MDNKLSTLELNALEEQEDTQLYPSRVLQLLNDEADQTMSVEVIVEFMIEERSYALLTPQHPVVLILREDAHDEEADLEAIDPSEFVKVSKNIQAALLKYKVHIEVQADEFVLLGEPEEEFYTESDIFEMETDDGPREFLILTEVDDGAFHYLVVMHIDPVIYPGEILEGERARLLRDDEMQDLGGIFQEILTEELEEEE